MGRTERETRRRIKAAVEQTAHEWAGQTDPARAANPDMKLMEIVPDSVQRLWTTYVLIMETEKLKWLTVVLTVLTAILAALTLRLALA